ncbi:MAG: hypothetical protein ACOZCK_06485, partial [Pseudomonadota bacterium]
IVSQQAVQQLLGYCFLCYGHHRSLGRGSFLPNDRLHKNSYTLPVTPTLAWPAISVPWLLVT